MHFNEWSHFRILIGKLLNFAKICYYVCYKFSKINYSFWIAFYPRPYRSNESPSSTIIFLTLLVQEFN